MTGGGEENRKPLFCITDNLKNKRKPTAMGANAHVTNGNIWRKMYLYVPKTVPILRGSCETKSKKVQKRSAAVWRSTSKQTDNGRPCNNVHCTCYYIMYAVQIIGHVQIFGHIDHCAYFEKLTSIIFAAASISPSTMWPYTSSVGMVEECPTMLFNMASGISFFNSDMNVWRKE